MKYLKAHCEITLTVLLISLAVRCAAAEAPALCRPLQTVITSGDFKSIQGAKPPRSKGSTTMWESAILLPGSTTIPLIATIPGAGDRPAERFYVTEFGTWENLLNDEPSFPDQAEIDSRFKALVNDLITCLPDWSRESSGSWNFAMQGPGHALNLFANADAENTWLSLRIDYTPGKSAVKQPETHKSGDLLDILNSPPVEEAFIDNRRNWLVNSTPEFSTTIAEGKYLIENKQDKATLFTWIPLSMNPESDYSITVRMSIESGENTPVGVLWATGGKEDCNALYLTRKGSVTWGEVVHGQWKGRDWTKCSCTGPIYSVLIQRRGDSVRMSVNGIDIGTAAHAPKGNLVGFGMNGIATVAVTRLSATTP